jgi:glycosyltransferase involved in cell wall biosynthesis
LDGSDVVNPLVSIVIPCYNQARFLADAIASASQQTYSPVEVLVVDDGSTDETAEIAARFPSVRYAYQRNQGTAAARNAGLRASRGDFLIFLDSDDRLLPHAAAAGVDYLREHADCAFVTGHVRLIGRDGAPAGVPPQTHANGNQYLALLRSNYIWTPGAIVYRRASLETVGGFDSRAGASADYELNIRLARNHSIACHHEIVLEYRRHGANMSADAGRMLRSALSVRRAEARHVRQDPAARRAWKEGIAIVKADYGRRLLAQIRNDFRRPGRRRRAIRDVFCLLRNYPAGFVRTLTARVASIWSA